MERKERESHSFNSINNETQTCRLHIFKNSKNLLEFTTSMTTICPLALFHGEMNALCDLINKLQFKLIDGSIVTKIEDLPLNFQIQISLNHLIGLNSVHHVTMMIHSPI